MATRATKAELQRALDETASALIEAEAMLARSEQRVRSLAVLLERAEQDRDAALGRLSTCAYAVGAFRETIRQLRADLSAALEASSGRAELRTGGL